jgi:hypothetical protein
MNVSKGKNDMAIVNLVKETMNVLDRYKKDFYKDVLWIGTEDGEYTCTHDEFLVLANVDYDNGYSGAEILQTLVVVGEDWWLSRRESDCAEWWKYNSKPTKYDDAQKLTSVLEYNECEEEHNV